MEEKLERAKIWGKTPKTATRDLKLTSTQIFHWGWGMTLREYIMYI
jgi:hypothetical protein